MTIGVLALQGDYAAHQKILESLGVQVRLVRAREDFDGLDGLVIPGGESTVMSRLCDRYELWAQLQALVENQKPLLGTCAGLIFLAHEIDGAASTFQQRTLQALDVAVARNAYGAQLDSFETELDVRGSNEPMRGVFIRAPKITRVGQGVEVLATHDEAPVLVRQGNIMAASFHPEIAGEYRVHQLWLNEASQSDGEK